MECKETAKEVAAFTAKRIGSILSTTSESAVGATLARLRRGIGRKPGAVPELWGDVLLEMSEELQGGNEPSRAEWAIYVALTMFALHQQGKNYKTTPMHVEGNSLGAAARCLIENEEDRERVARRFYPIAVASDMENLSRQLRSMITLLNAKGIPLDYVRLARDLFYYQFPEARDLVRLRWGEDFCRIVKE